MRNRPKTTGKVPTPGQTKLDLTGAELSFFHAFHTTEKPFSDHSVFI